MSARLAITGWLWMLIALVAVPVLSTSAPMEVSAAFGLALVGVALAGVMARALRGMRSATALPAGTRRATGEEQHRQGVFQRVSHPSAPGRPLPRAPQLRHG